LAAGTATGIAARELGQIHRDTPRATRTARFDEVVILPFQFDPLIPAIRLRPRRFQCSEDSIHRDGTTAGVFEVVVAAGRGISAAAGGSAEAFRDLGMLFGSRASPLSVATGRYWALPVH